MSRAHDEVDVGDEPVVVSTFASNSHGLQTSPPLEPAAAPASTPKKEHPRSSQRTADAQPRKRGVRTEAYSPFNSKPPRGPHEPPPMMPRSPPPSEGVKAEAKEANS